MWRESAAHSHPGHRISVPPHLRRGSRGCENACYHATKENEFSPVHSVIGFQRLKPPGFKSCGTGKGKREPPRYNWTAAPTIAAVSKAVEHLHSLNSPACSWVSITLPL